jgi:glycosyltransferase involved in cell wall biosynthesis
MDPTKGPLVSVVTPVYNGEDFLAECIESVLNQTYENFEYVIVNNCSKDRTLEIARDYASKDSRIRVHDNKEFVGVIANHNLAFSLISLAARYCKVVSGDDFIFPECLARMVDLGDANPSLGIIGCYQLSEDRIRWGGFRYPKAVISGREMCRKIFIEGDPEFGFGSPTSLLYRADLVRDDQGFYPNPSPHSDTSACFKALQSSSFGFVYQVLSFERIHTETQTHKSKKIDRYSSAYLSDLITYGPYYLSDEELSRYVKKALKSYRRQLGINYVSGSGGKEYWEYHEGRLKELGFPVTRLQLISSAVVAILDEMVNPGRAIGKVWRRLYPKSSEVAASTAEPHSAS